MGRFVRRLLHSLALLFGVSVVAFVLVDSAPGDFFDEMRLDPQISPSMVAALRKQYGMDRPLPAKYLAWVVSVARGEWGFSFAYNASASHILWPRLRNTLLLSGSATFLAWAIALPLGVLAGATRVRWIGSAVSLLTSCLIAIPELVLGILLLLFAVRTGYFPIGGMRSAALVNGHDSGVPWDVLRHLCLPGLCLIAGWLPLLVLHIRSAIQEILQAPFVNAARSYGIPRLRLLLVHVLPAAANPLISLFGLSLGMLISSSLLVEALFGWPGIGRLILESIQARDFFLVIDCTMLAAGGFILGNLTADLLLEVCDPRIRL